MINSTCVQQLTGSKLCLPQKEAGTKLPRHLQNLQIY